jgi:hypothetical protein
VSRERDEDETRPLFWQTWRYYEGAVLFRMANDGTKMCRVTGGESLGCVAWWAGPRNERKHAFALAQALILCELALPFGRVSGGT